MLLTIILIALSANVYINFLSQEPILNWWFKIGLKFEDNKYIYPPIWGCPMCNAGQMALWYYIFFMLNFSEIHSFVMGVFFVASTIGAAYIINKYIEW